MSAPPHLIGEAMHAGYGNGPDILQGCTIGVSPGEVAVIVGPNGAGKSTAVKAMVGMIPLRRGDIRLNGEVINALGPQERVLRGMGFVPQNENVFPSLTVAENLEMGAFVRDDNPAESLAEVIELFPVLGSKMQQAAGQLSGGQRKQVAVARALMARPKILILDEPTVGVSPVVMDELFERVCAISQSGVPILMVEQNARKALEIADSGYVLVQGRNAFSGSGAELLADPEVRQSFLGG